MSAKQPNRKPTGKRKESDASAQEGRERKRAAKRKGLKAGSRQQVEQAGKKSGSKQAKDPRIGSQAHRADCRREGQQAGGDQACKEKRVVMTPEQELASIENDDRLNDLAGSSGCR
jgi:ribosome assembly protein YihI (activator of Der GTPase)